MKKKEERARASASTNLMQRLARLAISVPCVPPCLRTTAAQRDIKAAAHTLLSMRV